MRSQAFIQVQWLHEDPVDIVVEGLVESGQSFAPFAPDLLHCTLISNHALERYFICDLDSSVRKPWLPLVESLCSEFQDFRTAYLYPLICLLFLPVLLGCNQEKSIKINQELLKVRNNSQKLFVPGRGR
jgi:hypothetical protein